MDIILATIDTQRLIYNAVLPEHHSAYGKDHLNDMCAKIINKEIQGEKAHRWLGWIQCAICIGGGATLGNLKGINSSSMID